MNKYQREYLNGWTEYVWTEYDKAIYRCSSPTCLAEFRDVWLGEDAVALIRCPYCGARLFRDDLLEIPEEDR